MGVDDCQILRGVLPTLPQKVCSDSVLHELRKCLRVFDALAEGGSELLGERNLGLDLHTVSVRPGTGDVNTRASATSARGWTVRSSQTGITGFGIGRRSQPMSVSQEEHLPEGDSGLVGYVGE